MLILTRKEGEALQIGDDITLYVHEVQGGRVRLGFDAPKSVQIVRSELLQVVEQNKEATLATSKNDVKQALQGLTL